MSIKIRLVFLSALLLGACAATAPQTPAGGLTITLSAETAAYCKAGGGCYPVTMPDAAQLAETAYALGRAHGCGQ